MTLQFLRYSLTVPVQVLFSPETLLIVEEKEERTKSLIKTALRPTVWKEVKSCAFSHTTGTILCTPPITYSDVIPLPNQIE